MKGYHSFVFLFMLCSFAVVFATVVFFVLRFSFSSPTNAAAGFNIHIVGKWFQLQRPFHILMTCAELKVGETRSDLFNTTSSLFIYHQHTPLHSEIDLGKVCVLQPDFVGWKEISSLKRSAFEQKELRQKNA